MQKMVDDTECIAEWRKLLKMFELLIKGNPEPKKIENELIELKEAAKAAKHLTFHQASAITERCDNYLKGQYGKTKTALNMSYESNGTPAK